MGKKRDPKSDPQNPTYLSMPLVAESEARSEGELLKETRSYCPTCLKELDARVFAVHGLVWLFKTCPIHGPSQGLAERNVKFYKAVMNVPPVSEKSKVGLVIAITHKCNLNCSICFVPKREREDLTAEQIKKIIEEAEIPWIVMSGGEPTVRKDLPELLKATRKAGKHVAINTNGIRLGNKNYVKKLADHGLEFVILSFNGLDDEIYRKINGYPLLDVKSKALENLIDCHIDTAISPTIIRGINDDLSSLIKLCFDHVPHVSELRLRGAAYVGRHNEFEPLVMSEMLELLAPTIGYTMDQFLEEFNPENCYHSVFQWNMHGVFIGKGKKKGKLVYWNPGIYGKTEPSVQDLQRKIRRECDGEIRSGSLSNALKTMDINLWHWPDRYNIDLEETKSHGVTHLYDNRLVMNFHEAMIRAYDL